MRAVGRWGRGAVALLLAAQALAAQPARQTSAGEYTRYELLAPESGKFRILYEVWATTAGTRYFYNPIRKGSVASDESVRDLASGEPLKFEEIDGAAARAGGFVQADTGTRYLRVELPRAVPKDGVSRILIDKTYFDPRSYSEENNGDILFSRSLGIKRNAILSGQESRRMNIVLHWFDRLRSSEGSR